MPLSVGLLWTSDRPAVERQHSRETDIHAPGGIELALLASERVQPDPFRRRGHSDQPKDNASCDADIIHMTIVRTVRNCHLNEHGNSNCSKLNQRDAVQQVFYCTLVGSTCFGCRRHPSSGAQYVQSRSIGTMCV